MTGEDSLEIRTIGQYNAENGTYSETFMDAKRAKEVDSEAAEVVKALDQATQTQKAGDIVEFIYEIADLIIQLKILEEFRDELPNSKAGYASSPDYYRIKKIY